jgi:methionine synthase II (cobalamin-independent)
MTKVKTLNQLTTMIGSLPQKSVEEAFHIMKKYPVSLPVWPQLPKRNFKEGMIPQYSEGFPGIKIDEKNKKIWLERDDTLLDVMSEFYEHIVAENFDAFALSSNYAAGFHHFYYNLKHNNGKIKAVKGQVTGPFTFGLGVNDNKGKALWFDEQYRDIVIKGLMMKALWQIRQLKKYAEKVIIFFDEPILSALGTPGYLGIGDEEVINVLNELSDACHVYDALIGVHCCGNMDWGLLARTYLDIIAFDAYYYGEKVALYPEEISAFLDRGGYLAWGIVPTNDPETLQKETVESLKDALENLILLFIKKGIPEENIHSRMIFTPSCGMGSLPEESAKTVLELLSRLTPS